MNLKVLTMIYKKIRFYIISLLILLVSVVFSGILEGKYEENKKNEILYGQNYEKAFEKYLEKRNDSVDKWITFLGILSTLFAVFFVYSGFKIDRDLREIQNKGYEFLDKFEEKYKEKVKELNIKSEQEKKEINEKNEEEKEELKNENNFLRQMSFFENMINIDGNFDEAINGLNSLLKNDYISKDSEKYNRVIYLISKSFYGKWQLSNDTSDLSQALIFANEAIEDVNDPYKKLLTEEVKKTS